MSDPDSSEGSESEVPEDQQLEEITADSLKGRWQHSAGDYLVCKEGEALFDQGLKFSLNEVDNTMELDGWRANPEKSTANKIVWQKNGETSNWRFESDLEEEVGALDEEVDTTNIITGKRRRQSVNYEALNKKMDEEEGKEDDDGEEAVRAKKKAKLEALAQSMATSGSASSKYTFSPTKKAAVPASKKLTHEELKQLKARLSTEGPLRGADEVLPLVKQLERHPMTLDDLKATKIGIAVNRYRKHTNSTIASRIQAVVASWKGLLKPK